MTPFEQELKRALARREPSEDFTARVMAKTVASEQAPRQAAATKPSFWFPVVPMFSRFAAFALLAVVLAAGAFYQHRARQEKGEAAKQQLMTALHIAGKQLHDAQRRVKRIEFPEVVMQ